jgi:hypothetical protein
MVLGHGAALCFAELSVVVILASLPEIKMS